MSSVNILLVVVMLLLFPISIYLNTITYLRTMDIKEKKYFLDFTLMSTLFLLIKFDFYGDLYIIIFFNIPLLIAFLKDRKATIFIMTITLTWFYYKYLSYDLTLVISEYIFYILFYFWCLRYKKPLEYVVHIFVIVESFTMGFLYFYTNQLGIIEIKNFIYLVFVMILFIVVTYVIIKVFKLAEKIAETGAILKQLKKEKNLRLSLFKIAHEVKNPLAVCKGYLSMLNTDDIDNSIKYIDIVKDEVDKTLVIIDDFSNFGKIKLDKDILDICYVVEEVVDTLEVLLKKNNTIINLDSVEDEIIIEGDYNKIKQVIVNLIKNSIEAKRKNELKIDIKFKIDNIGYVNIIIKDNGIGMSKDDLVKISEPFFSNKENGTGLGVALSKEIIELHGGSIRYKSILEKGTTVILSLPLK